MTDTTALAIRAASAITKLENIAEIRDTWVESKRRELAQAEAAVAALTGLHGRDNFRVKRAIARRQLLARVVRAMERGFIPIPRFDGRKLTAMDELPVSALVALNASGARKVFDEIRFVTGSGETRAGRTRRVARDPLIIGVLRFPGHHDPATATAWNPRGVWHPGREEHFLVAWWRPEDETDEVMF